MSSLPNIVVGLCLRDQPRDLVDLVGLDQHRGPAGGKRRHRLVETEDAAQRQDRKRQRVGRGEAEGARHLLGMAGDRALAVQHELGRAGRARGREDVAGCARQRVVGGDCRARQHAVERHAAQPLDGGRHRGGLVADDDDRGEPVERRRLDVGQDRQEIDAAEAGGAGQHLGARAARRCRRPRRRDSACSRRRRWRPAARRRNREWDRPARWAATAPPDRPARRRDRPGPGRRAPNSRAVRRSSASARHGGRPAQPAFPRRCRPAASRRRRRDG